MKLSELIALRPAMEKIARKEMSPEAALEFAKFTREALVLIQDFEQKRAELFQKHGEVVDDQGNMKIKPENEKKFNAAIKRQLDKEVEFEPFDISKLKVDLSPADLVNALGLFK